MDLAEELRAVVTALDAQGVPYALVGGLAVAVWGVPRATKDIDLLVPPASVEEAKRALSSIGYTLEAGLMDFSDGMTVARVSKVDGNDLMTVDLLFVTPNLEAAFASRVSRPFGTTPLVVISRDGLIQMKLQAGRPQDQVDVMKLLEIDR